MGYNKQTKEKLELAIEYSKKGSPEVMDMFLKALEGIVSKKKIEKIRQQGYENAVNRILRTEKECAEKGHDYSGLLLTVQKYAHKCGQNDVVEAAKERYNNFILARDSAWKGQPYVTEIFLSRLKPSALTEKIQKNAWGIAAKNLLNELNKYVGIEDNSIAKSYLRQAWRFAQRGEIDLSNEIRDAAEYIDVKIKHPPYVEGYRGTLEELAQAVGRISYDKVEEFLNYLAQDLERQSKGDLERGRPNLAMKLNQTALRIHDAETRMKEIWELCKPYMKDGLEFIEPTK